MESTKESLEQMVQDGIIAKVEGPTDWVSSMVVREKTDGKLRICLDPSDLNKALKREHYPSRTTEEVNHKFVNAKFFTKLDAKNGYWNVKLDEESSCLTTFNTPFGRYRFLRLPFGLKVSQDIFQCLMDDAYQNCRGAVNIADDVEVYGRDEKDYDRNLHEAVEKTRKSGIKLNDRPEKCQVKKESVKFYGNMYTTEGIKPDPNKVSAIKAIQPPNNKAELHTFLGMVNLHGKICEELSRPYSVAAIIIATRCGIPMVWPSHGSIRENQEPYQWGYHFVILWQEQTYHTSSRRVITWTRSNNNSRWPTHCFHK